MASVHSNGKEDEIKEDCELTNHEASEIQFESNAPDGGWGWMIVLSSFIIHIIIDGISYSFGVLAEQFVLDLRSSRQLNGWIGSTLVGVTLGGGPIASAASAKFGHRFVTMAGAVIAAAGFAASFFVTSAWQLIITVGCIAGFGMSLIFLPAIVCVGLYFESRRSTAIGIAVCGSGLGTLLFSPLFVYLVDLYTWRGTFLILSGVILHCVPLGALFRPLSQPDRPSRPTPVARLRDHVRSRRMSADCLVLDDSTRPADFLSVPDVSDRLSDQEALRSGQRAHSSPFSLHLPLSGAVHIVRSDMNVAAAAEEEAAAKKTSKSPTSAFHFSLLKRPAFSTFLVSNLLSSIGFDAPFLYTPDRAMRAGESPTRASLLVSVIGLANMVGRLAFGCASDNKRVNRLALYGGALAVAGFSLVATCSTDAYWMQVACCAVFGLFTGTFVTLTSPVLVDLLGLEKLSDSFGLTLLFQGVGVIVGPPMAGFLYDTTRSFDIPFIVCGVSMSVSGLMLLPIFCWRWRRGQQMRHQRENTLEF